MSKSLVNQVERGVVPASVAFTTVTARALGVEVEELAGGCRWPVTDPDTEHAGIAQLRAALVAHPAPEGVLLSVAELRAGLVEADRFTSRARYTQLLEVLPELLAQAHQLAAEAGAGQEAQTATVVLDDAYACAHVVAYRFGYPDLAALASSLRRWTCEQVGDPLRAAAAVTGLVHLRLRCGDLPGVHQLLERTQVEIGEQHGPVADAVRVQLHLLQGLAHGRGGDRERAEEHLSAARDLTGPGVPVHPYHGIRASAVNVEIHRVRVPLESCDAATALARAERLRLPAAVEPTRAGRHWVTVAQAWTLHGERILALRALQQARQAAPQLTRYHPLVRHTVHQLAETGRFATGELAGFARWIGLTL